VGFLRIQSIFAAFGFVGTLSVPPERSTIMFLRPPDSQSPYFQVIYKVNGKRTKISTKTSKRSEAEKFLKHFDPQAIQKKTKRETSINLSSFILSALRELSLMKIL
jgi:hypothetical protein